MTPFAASAKKLITSEMPSGICDDARHCEGRGGIGWLIGWSFKLMLLCMRARGGVGEGKVKEEGGETVRARVLKKKVVGKKGGTIQ